MPKTELDGLPVIHTDESEEITVAVKAEDIKQGNPITIALRRQRGVAGFKTRSPGLAAPKSGHGTFTAPHHSQGVAHCWNFVPSCRLSNIGGKMRTHTQREDEERKAYYRLLRHLLTEEVQGTFKEQHDPRRQGLPT